MYDFVITKFEYEHAVKPFFDGEEGFALFEDEDEVFVLVFHNSIDGVPSVGFKDLERWIPAVDVILCCYPALFCQLAKRMGYGDIATKVAFPEHNGPVNASRLTGLGEEVLLCHDPA